jgi:hypothetical protein
MDHFHYKIAMAKDVYLTALLTLLLRAIIDDSLPFHSELELLLTFLLQSEATEKIHSTFFTEALSDWVTRLMRGIEAATFIPSCHKRRALSITPETPSLSLSTSTSSFTAMMTDAIGMGKEIVATSTPSTPPRFKVLSIDDHKIDGRGRLSYKVQWEGAGSLPTREP